MAAYTDIDATVGGSSANSYVTGAEADSFAGLQSWGSAWLAKTESERTIALISACSWLETIDWAGGRCHPSSDDAALPRRCPGLGPGRPVMVLLRSARWCRRM